MVQNRSGVLLGLFVQFKCDWAVGPELSVGANEVTCKLTFTRWLPWTADDWRQTDEHSLQPCQLLFLRSSTPKYKAACHYLPIHQETTAA